MLERQRKGIAKGKALSKYKRQDGDGLGRRSGEAAGRWCWPFGDREEAQHRQKQRVPSHSRARHPAPVASASSYVPSVCALWLAGCWLHGCRPFENEQGREYPNADRRKKYHQDREHLGSGPTQWCSNSRGDVGGLGFGVAAANR